MGYWKSEGGEGSQLHLKVSTKTGSTIRLGGGFKQNVPADFAEQHPLSATDICSFYYSTITQYQEISTKCH